MKPILYIVLTPIFILFGITVCIRALLLLIPLCAADILDDDDAVNTMNRWVTWPK